MNMKFNKKNELILDSAKISYDKRSQKLVIMVKDPNLPKRESFALDLETFTRGIIVVKKLITHHDENELTLDSAKISYDEKNVEFVITIKDPNLFTGEPFTVSLIRNTRGYAILRELITLHGLKKSERSTREVLFANRDAKSDNAQLIPLGLNDKNEEALWEPAEEAHLALIGTNDAVQHTRKNIQTYVSKFPEQWRYEQISTGLYTPENLGVTPNDNSLNELVSAEASLVTITLEMQKRYQQMVEENVYKYTKLSHKTPAIMVLVDDFDKITAPLPENDSPQLDYSEYRLARKNIIRHLANISRQGRSAGIHLVISAKSAFDDEPAELYGLYGNMAKFDFPFTSGQVGLFEKITQRGIEEIKTYYSNLDGLGD